MVGLFFLGRDVEEAYGSREFLRLYLAMVVFASVVWNVANKLAGTPDMVAAYGASGAIAGVVVLYALNFPRRTLLLFFVIPMPAWLCGVLLVGMDMLGATGRAGAANVAYSMHLAGAAFAFIYYQRRWNLTGLSDRLFHFRWPNFRRRPRLRIHRPQASPPARSERGGRSHPGEDLPRRRSQPYGQGTPNPGDRQPPISAKGEGGSGEAAAGRR